MLTFYLSSFVFGLILIGASLILGDSDLDADVEIDADVDVEADGDVEHGAHGGTAHEVSSALPFFSVRFWTFFLASFGMAGALLTWMGTSLPIHLPMSIVTGAGIGSLVWWTFEQLKKGATNATDLGTLRGQEAEVIVAIAPGKTGKIRLLTEGRHVDMLATTQEDRVISRGTKVLVVTVEDALACVTPLGPRPIDEATDRISSPHTRAETLGQRS